MFQTTNQEIISSRYSHSIPSPMVGKCQERGRESSGAPPGIDDVTVTDTSPANWRSCR